jgi:hypothetical protein
MLLALSLSPLLGLTSITAAPTPQRYPNPEPCLGNCSWIHDPSIIKEDNRYYRFSTSGNIAIATAPSLSGPWEYKGALLDNGTNIYVDSSQDIWAPSIHKIGDEYYAFVRPIFPHSFPSFTSRRFFSDHRSTPFLSWAHKTRTSAMRAPHHSTPGHGQTTAVSGSPNPQDTT